MIYKHHRFAFCLTYSACNSIIAVGFVAGPFVVTGTSVPAYRPLPNIPFCVFIPNNHSGKVLLLADTLINYVIYWLATCFSMIGENCYAI